MRILFFSPRPFWPQDTGAKLRDYHLARQLALRAEVSYLGFAENGSTEPPAGASTAVFDRVVMVRRDKGYTPSKLVRGIIGSVPVTVLNYTTPAMKTMLAGLLEARPYDAVQMESVHLAEYLPIVRQARHQPKVISDWHNIESEVMHRYSLQCASMAERLYAKATASRLEATERRLLAGSDAVCVCSSRERRYLEEWNPPCPVEVVENGVDCASFDEGPAAGDRTSLLYVGSMDYHANVDAVVYFAESIWPSLHAAHPDLEFKIVGRNPVAAVKTLAAKPGIVVTGSVPDVRPYYREALASVVPLRVGGGTRLKILEAMAAGTPVVSTALGAEGLKVNDGHDLLLAESAGDFLGAVATLRASAAKARQIGENGRDMVRARYDWSAIGAVLFECHRRAVETGSLTGASR